MVDLKLYGCVGNEIDNLVQTAQVVSEDIALNFGIKKCAVLGMKTGKEIDCNRIDLSDGRVIKSIDDEGC